MSELFDLVNKFKIGDEEVQDIYYQGEQVLAIYYGEEVIYFKPLNNNTIDPPIIEIPENES